MNNNIELISYAKLAEYDQARTDLPIRKYVLIANFLRDPKSHLLEQRWFDTCLSELDQDEDIDSESPPPPPPPPPPPMKDEKTTNVQLHAYYNFNHRNGFLLYTSNL